MIEFSRNSWHYRAADFISTGGVPRSLCPYVRAVMFGGFFWTVLVSFASWLVVSFLLTVAALVTGGSFLALPQWIQVGTIVTMFLGALVAAIYGAEQYQEWKNRRRYAKYEAEYQAKRDGGEYVPPQPSLLRLYWNALHEKICPVIEFKGNDTSPPIPEDA